MPATPQGMKQVGGFNVSEEVAKAFKDFCAENGGSYPAGFTVLMELAKQEDTKMKLTDRGATIDEFKLTVQRLLELYTQSLELSVDAEARAAEKVSLQLQTQAEDIKTARDKNSELTALIEGEKDEKASLLKEVQRLTAELDQMKDKQMLIDMLTAKNADLETENAAAKETLDKVAELKAEYSKQIDELEEQSRAQKQQITELNSNLLISKKDAEIANNQLSEAKKERSELQSKLDQERESSQARYDQILAKLEAEREKREALQEQLSQKDQELIKLQMQLTTATKKEEKKSTKAIAGIETGKK